MYATINTSVDAQLVRLLAIQFGLEMDWDGSPSNYTCYSPKLPFAVNTSIADIRECQLLDKDYVPKHKCIKEPIYYNDSVPTFGDHRPLWPVFGEYTFVPVQRWLHSVEVSSSLYN